jgi:hypothetical protein
MDFGNHSHSDAASQPGRPKILDYTAVKSLKLT